MAKARRVSTEVAEVYTEWVLDLNDQQLLCRDIGHTWRPFRAYLTEYGYERILRCPRCRTERAQSLSPRGHVLEGHYSYPDGYLAPKGVGRMDSDARDLLRLESIGRLIAKEEE